MAIKIKEALTLGAWVTATVIVLETILGFLKVQTVQLYGIQPVTGITPTIGAKLIDLINGLNIVNINVLSIVYLLLSATIVVFVGNFLYGLINIPKGLAGWQKLAAVLFYGTIPFGILLVWGMKIPSGSVIVMLAVYYIAVAITLGLLKKTAAKIRI